MASTIGPPMALLLTPLDLSIMPPLALASIEGEVAPPIDQAPSSLGGDDGQPKEILIEVENITTSLDKAFMVEAIIPSQRVLVEVGDAADSLKEMVGITSSPIIDLPAGMISTTSPPSRNPTCKK